MRIVTRAELMSMPPGTLYHEWQPCSFGSLCIKGDTIPAEAGTSGDWWEANIPSLDVGSSEEDWDKQFAMAETGIAHPLNHEIEGREALFDDSLRYAVWERADVLALRARLDKYLRETVA